MSYARRRINVTFQLGIGSFGDSGFNKIKMGTGTIGLQIYAHIEFATAPTTGVLQLRIWGMSLDHMNQLSKAGLEYAARSNNGVMVEAGDDDTGMTVVWNGLMVEAYPDFRNQPDVSFYVMATPTPVIQLKPVPPTTFPGPVSAATALQQIVQKAGLTLENNGVNTILASPYFPGSAWTQILSVIKAADVFGFVDGIKKLLAIWPKDGSRSGGEAIISAANGMINYPSFQANNVIVRTEFNPKMLTDVGQLITIQSTLIAANGRFQVVAKNHELSSELPDGPWETILKATPLEQNKT